MTERPDDLVKVASGELTLVQVWGNALEVAGIQSNVVGGDLASSLGSAFPDSAELWVHRQDAEKATAIIVSHEHPKGGSGHHGHPVSDPKPDTKHGHPHTNPPHRPLPS